MVTLYKRQQIISFFVLLLLVFVLVLFVLKPFLNILILGVILAILFQPAYKNILAKLKSPNASALLVVLLILLILLLPVAFFGQVIFSQLLDSYNKFHSGGLVISKDQIGANLPVPLQNLIEVLSRNINNWLANLASNLFQSFSSIISNIAGFFISLFLLFFSLFYLIRDSEKIKKLFMDILPIATRQENILINKITLAVNGVVRGSFLRALSQGVMAVSGFLIFGIPNAVVWGLFMILTSLVPTVGSYLTLVPAVAYLVLIGHIPAAIGLAIWGVLGATFIDNYLGPKFVGSRANLHPLLVLLSILGGITFFGFLGFLIGPILMAIFVALIDMYRTDFKDYMQSS